MDPQASWDRMLSAYAATDLASAQEYAQALKNWIHRGGFSPTVLGHLGISADFERALVLAGCAYILGLDLPA